MNLIVAINKNYGIGYKGVVPWHSPQDMKFFRATTINSTVVMGRITYESIGKPLPKRRNIVITSKNINDVETATSLDNALQSTKNDEKVFIIGGEMVYREAISKQIADKIYVSWIDDNSETDAVFPYQEMKNFYKMVDIIKVDCLFVEVFEKK